MKVSEWLRKWQMTGEVPDGGGPEFAFWAGWLIANGKKGLDKSFDEAREMAIKAAEFIEGQVS